MCMYIAGSHSEKEQPKLIAPVFLQHQAEGMCCTKNKQYKVFIPPCKPHIQSKRTNNYLYLFTIT